MIVRWLISMVLICCGFVVSPAWAEPEPSLAQRLMLKETTAKVQAPEDNLGNSALRLVQGLGICLGALGILIFTLRKKIKGNFQFSSKRMRVLERMPLTSKTTLLLVQMDSKTIMLAVGGEKVSFADNEGTFNIGEASAVEVGEWDRKIPATA